MSSLNSSEHSAKPVHVKRYGSGRYYLCADAATEHQKIVEQAVTNAAKICIQFDAVLFRTALSAAGISDEAIEKYLASVSVIDEVYGAERNA